MLNAVPRSLVSWLLLAPDNTAGFRVALDLGLKILVREGIQLLDADNGHIFDAMFAAVRREVIINLSGAGDQPPDVIGIQIFYLWYYRPEPAVSDILEARYRFLVAQQALRAHQDKWFAKRADHLASQNVKHLRGGGGNAYLDIVFRAQLQIAFKTRRRVFRPLSLIAMRQHHDQPAQASPLDFSGRNELIYHHLGAIGEIPELGFPNLQLIRLCRGITVFERKHGFLG